MIHTNGNRRLQSYHRFPTVIEGLARSSSSERHSSLGGSRKLANRGLLKDSNNSGRNLRVKFILPHDETQEAKEIEVFPDERRTSLPAICEFMIFANNKKNEEHKKTLISVPRTAPKTQRTKTTRPGEQLFALKSTVVKLPPAEPKCTTKNLKIETKFKLPSEYEEPTFMDKNKRIFAWLSEADNALPAYRRRMNIIRRATVTDLSELVSLGADDGKRGRLARADTFATTDLLRDAQWVVPDLNLLFEVPVAAFCR
ncbi:uncharacterized protein LOC5521589 isoform X1 [Nematostella vectensis]|uniref:uncharacterized protein LOC5521589 isoform X1 n=1 Tax=Nematostella vectensis TaxID=45351 RepID=UPI0013905F6F|nr:uncharacterized protein LOC5521589 isoform X1 [Nematostella vectensis]